jgi:hypothetical protein
MGRGEGDREGGGGGDAGLWWRRVAAVRRSGPGAGAELPVLGSGRWGFESETSMGGVAAV